ncbi:hypothetical protein M8C21_028978 [Ambrosia artemisiifolia]|uniref:Uncharacterized protein n=1 Tax=Ambrosia artemisiifolia TaxID=4212 RepID=A0AAD5G1G4_AMBAR|nr:hypothetical protein M8C21_028978 [Ambrosia artemisiifolia]
MKTLKSKHKGFVTLYPPILEGFGKMGDLEKGHTNDSGIAIVVDDLSPVSDANPSLERFHRLPRQNKCRRKLYFGKGRPTLWKR